jgi:tRNA threonylcarbamoyl adenosine modification protein YeaZ
MTSPISSTAGKLTLAIETSAIQGSLAVDGFQVAWEKKAIHSEMATVQLQELLKKAGASLADIGRISVDCGPGSFTGIRVGVNLGRSLSYALGIPAKSFNALELLAGRGGSPGDTVFVAIKAIQNFYYCAGYTIGPKGLDQSLAPCSLGQEQIESASAGYTKVLVEGRDTGFSPHLEAAEMLQALARWPERATFLSWNTVQPVYIRASEAEEKLLKGLLKT